VPLALGKAGPATVIASSGGATVYASADLTKLFYSPAPSQPARQVLRLPAGYFLAHNDIVGLALGPGYLGWTTARMPSATRPTSATAYVASTASLAAAPLTDGRTDYTMVRAAGRFLIAAGGPVGPPLSVLSGATIDHLTCAG
jgi:hypothetical protein